MKMYSVMLRTARALDINIDIIVLLSLDCSNCIVTTMSAEIRLKQVCINVDGVLVCLWHIVIR